MNSAFTRRSVVAGGASLLALGAAAPAARRPSRSCALAAPSPKPIFAPQAYKEFAAAIKDDFDFEPYWGNTLFKQGTELVALQRDNLELCNLAPADISKQIPAWSLLTSAYLFRDADHLKKTFKSDVGKDFSSWRGTSSASRSSAGLFRSAQRQPQAGQADQDAGRHGGHQAAHAARRILAIPRGVARRQSDAGRLRRALHRAADRHGRRPGQSAVVASKLMKFDEVTTQFVLTSHVIGYDVMSIRSKSLGRDQARSTGEIPRRSRKDVRRQCRAIRRSGERRRSNTSRRKARRSTSRTRTLSAPSRRSIYVEKYGKDWPKGALERINAVK